MAHQWAPPRAGDWLQLLEAAASRREELLATLALVCAGVRRKLQAPDRDAVLDLVADIRREGVAVVEAVRPWRLALAEADPWAQRRLEDSGGAHGAAAAQALLTTPFLYRGRDYLLKMLHDCDFIGDVPEVCALLRLAPEACFFNPLFAPSNLGVPVKSPAVPAVTEFLVAIAAAEGHRRLLGRALVRDFVEDRSRTLGEAFGSSGSGRSSPSGSGDGFAGGRAPPGADFAQALAGSSQMLAPPVTPLTRLIANAAASSMHISLAMSNKHVITATAFRAGVARADDIVETDVRALLEQVPVRSLVERVRMVRAQTALAEEAMTDPRMAEARSIGSVSLGALGSVVVRDGGGPTGGGSGGGSGSPRSSATAGGAAVAAGSPALPTSPAESISSLALSPPAAAGTPLSAAARAGAPSGDTGASPLIAAGSSGRGGVNSAGGAADISVGSSAQVRAGEPLLPGLASASVASVPNTVSAEASYFSLDPHHDAPGAGALGAGRTAQPTAAPAFSASVAGHARGEPAPSSKEALRVEREARERKDKEDYTLTLARKLQEQMRLSSSSPNASALAPSQGRGPSSGSLGAGADRSVSPSLADDALALANSIVANLSDNLPRSYVAASLASSNSSGVYPSSSGGGGSSGSSSGGGGGSSGSGGDGGGGSSSPKGTTGAAAQPMPAPLSAPAQQTTFSTPSFAAPSFAGAFGGTPVSASQYFGGTPASPSGGAVSGMALLLQQQQARLAALLNPLQLPGSQAYLQGLGLGLGSGPSAAGTPSAGAAFPPASGSGAGPGGGLGPSAGGLGTLQLQALQLSTNHSQVSHAGASLGLQQRQAQQHTVLEDQASLFRQALQQQQPPPSLGGLPLLSAMPMHSGLTSHGNTSHGNVYQQYPQQGRSSGITTSVYTPLPGGSHGGSSGSSGSGGGGGGGGGSGSQWGSGQFSTLSASVASSLQHQGGFGASAEVPEEHLEGGVPSRPGSRGLSRGGSSDLMTRELWGKSYVQPVRGPTRRPGSIASDMRDLKRAHLTSQVGDLERRVAAQNVQLAQLQALQSHLISRAKRAASGRQVKGTVLNDAQLAALRRMSERGSGPGSGHGPGPGPEPATSASTGGGGLSPAQLQQMQHMQQQLQRLNQQPSMTSLPRDLGGSYGGGGGGSGRGFTGAGLGPAPSLDGDTNVGQLSFGGPSTFSDGLPSRGGFGVGPLHGTMATAGTTSPSSLSLPPSRGTHVATTRASSPDPTLRGISPSTRASPSPSMRVKPMFPRMKQKAVAVRTARPARSAASRLPRGTGRASPASSSTGASPGPASATRRASPSPRLPSPSPSVGSRRAAPARHELRGRSVATALPGPRVRRPGFGGGAVSPSPLTAASRTASPSPARSTVSRGIASAGLSASRSRSVTHIAPSPSPTRPATRGGQAASPKPVPASTRKAVQRGVAQGARSASPQSEPSPSAAMRTRPLTSTATNAASPRPPLPRPVASAVTPPLQMRGPSASPARGSHARVAATPVAAKASALVVLRPQATPASAPAARPLATPARAPSVARGLVRMGSNVAALSAAATPATALPAVVAAAPPDEALSPATVKVTVAGNVFRLHLEKSTLAGLASSCASLVRGAPRIERFTFLDDEGDTVTLLDDANLLEALATSKATGKIARFDARFDAVSPLSSRPRAAVSVSPSPAPVALAPAPAPAAAAEPTPPAPVALDAASTVTSAAVVAAAAKRSVAFPPEATAVPLLKFGVSALEGVGTFALAEPSSAAQVNKKVAHKQTHTLRRSASPRGDIDRVQQAMGGAGIGGSGSNSPSIGAAFAEGIVQSGSLESHYNSALDAARATSSPLRRHFGEA